MLAADQIAALKTLYPAISAAEEGQVTFLRIENLVLPDGANPQTVTGLLCPVFRDGYQSRLFLSAKVAHPGKGTNWNADGVLILGQRWWAVSWQTKAGQTLTEMVLDHLQAFRQ
jgi:hypothetical protein